MNLGLFSSLVLSARKGDNTHWALDPGLAFSQMQTSELSAESALQSWDQDDRVLYKTQKQTFLSGLRKATLDRDR